MKSEIETVVHAFQCNGSYCSVLGAVSGIDGAISFTMRSATARLAQIARGVIFRFTGFISQLMSLLFQEVQKKIVLVVNASAGANSGVKHLKSDSIRGLTVKIG